MIDGSLLANLASAVADQVPLTGLGIGSGWSLAAYGVFLVYRGRFVPRELYDAVDKERNDLLQVVTMQAKQLDAVMEVGETVEVIMRAVESNARRRSP